MKIFTTVLIVTGKLLWRGFLMRYCHSDVMSELPYLGKEQVPDKASKAVK